MSQKTDLDVDLDVVVMYWDAFPYRRNLEWKKKGHPVDAHP